MIDVSENIGAKIDLEVFNDDPEYKTPKYCTSQLLDVRPDGQIVMSIPSTKVGNVYLRVGTKLKFSIQEKESNSGYFISFSGEVTEHSKENSVVTFIVKTNNDYVRSQRRRFFRITSNICFHDSKFKGKLDTGDDVLIKDLSACGSCIVSAKSLDVDSFINLSLLYEDKTPFNIKAKVIRCEKGIMNKETVYISGLSFDNITTYDQERIIRIIFKEHRREIFFRKKGSSRNKSTE